MNILSTEIAWLAGFLDADGSIRLRMGRKNKSRTKTTSPHSLVPQVTFFNTCRLTGNKIAELIGRSFTDFKATITQDASKNSWNAKITIEIGGISRCEPFLKMIRPYLVTKAGEADLLLRFCEIRNERGRAPYGEEEYLLCEALKYMKKSRHLRDYTPSVEEILNEDIVRTNAKALEVAEMATRLTDEEKKDWAKNLVSDYRWNKSGRKSNS